ncbi:two-component response regulator ARR10-like [Apium graveolens]|uniref:two-component response regulator ARR10-like n=1 Tax=Apium graveolens TaxID=4045 RepID=UPI003D78F212
MSGDREASYLYEGSQSGASHFVVKPITTEDLKSIWDFVNQWKKNLAKGKNLISDHSSAKDNEDDTGNKLYEKKSKRKLQITNNEDHNHGKNRVLKDKALLTKKNKLNWTPFLHDKFVRAVQHLGPEGSIPRNIVTVMNVPGLRREQVASHLQKYRIDQEKQSEAEQNPDLFKTLQNGKRWSSSFLSHKALPGYGQTKLPTNPGFRPSGLTNGTYPSLMGQEVCNTFISQRNLTSSTFDNVLPEQQYEPADQSNLFLDGSTCQSPGKV